MLNKITINYNNNNGCHHIIHPRLYYLVYDKKRNVIYDGAYIFINRIYFSILDRIKEYE